MDRIENINVERIRWCCDDRGVTPEELASAVNIAPKTFDAVMAGEKGLTFNQLRRIAEYFNRGLLFFLEEGDITAEDVYTPQFRTIANQKPTLPGDLKALIERVEHQRDIYLALRDDLEQELPLFDPPDIPENPVVAANIARAWLGLSTESRFDDYRNALEHRGILVFRSNGYAGRWQINKDSTIAGFTVYDETCPVIFVRKEAIEERQTFTMMHELGHVLLHRASFIDEVDDLFSYADKEREANALPSGYDRPDWQAIQCRPVQRVAGSVSHALGRER